MIKLITKSKTDCWPHQTSIDELLEKVKDKKIVQFDIETTGLSAYKNRPTAIQVGFDGVAYVVDTRAHDLSLFQFLEDKTCIGHNIKFDCLFMAVHAGIFIDKVYDTYIAELLMTNGTKVKRDLGSLIKKYTGTKVNKSAQKTIALTSILTKRNIEYSGTDVLHLETICRKQCAKLRSMGLYTVAIDEMRTIPAFTYMEYSGFKIDKEQWTENYEHYHALTAEIKQQLDGLVIEADPNLQSTQGNLFSSMPETMVNWNSPDQAKQVFVGLGVLEDGASACKEDLKKIEHPILDKYIDYKETKKSEGTYGKAFLRHVETDGRVHTRIKQLVRTGRTSSSPNLQNIPKKSQFRKPFIPGEGNKLIICDYGGQESIILADTSRDEKLLEFYQSGGGDLHSYVARLIWWDELKDLTLGEIKLFHSEKRQKAKSANFAIVYGGNGGTIAKNLNIPRSEGDRIFKSFMKVFGGMEVYFEAKFRETVELGYILINEKSGRKRYFDFWGDYMNLYNIVNQPSFWPEFRDEKRKGSSYFYRELLPMKERYYNWEHTVRKAAMNTPIQGTAADQKKRAMRNFYRWICDNDLRGVVRTPIEVHDEIVAECPADMADVVARELQLAMEEAGNHYLDILTISADPVIADYWWEDKED